MAEVRSSLGRHQAKPLDAAAAKRRGWRLHGLPVVSAHGPRPTRPERALVKQLGAKLSGPHEDGREDRHGR